MIIGLIISQASPGCGPRRGLCGKLLILEGERYL